MRATEHKYPFKKTKKVQDDVMSVFDQAVCAIN